MYLIIMMSSQNFRRVLDNVTGQKGGCLDNALSTLYYLLSTFFIKPRLIKLGADVLYLIPTVPRKLTVVNG